MGFELPNANMGEFQFGFSESHRLNASVGLQGDQAALGSTIPADQWHIVNMVLQQNPSGSNANQYQLRTYLNGVLIGYTGHVDYGTPPGNQIVNSPFGVGYNVINSPDRRFLDGEIALLRFYDHAITSSEILAESQMIIASVPEPNKGILIMLALLGGCLNRKKD